MSVHPTKSLFLNPSSALLLPIFSRPLPAAILTGPLTARTTVGHPITLIYDPAYAAYPSYRRYLGDIGPAIEEDLGLNCSPTFSPCPGFRIGVFSDLGLFNAWIAKIWGLPPESGSIAPIVVLGRRDIVRGGPAMSLRDREIRSDANFAADPDTNTHPPAGTPVPTPGDPAPTSPRANNTPDHGGTIQIFGPASCAFCVAAMNYLESMGVLAEKIDITTASDPRLVSALTRASVLVRGGGTPIIIHTKGLPRLTQGFNEADLRARYFVSAPTPRTPRPPRPEVPTPGDPAPPAPLAPVFTSTFVGPLTYTFATEGTTSRSWSFGDRLVSTDMNPTHTYSAPGTYIVSLRMPADSTSVTTSTLEVIAGGTPGTITPSTPPAPSSKSSNPFPFIVGAGLVYGVFSLWRKLRK